MATTDADRRRLTGFLTSLDLRDADELEELTDAALNAYVVLALSFRRRHPEAYDRWRLQVAIAGLEAETDPRPH
jgi:hypothetical protein